MKNESNLLNLMRNSRILTLDKLTVKEIYPILVLTLKETPTSRNSFPNYTFDWKQIYLLPRIITINNYQRNFQYKILHNVLTEIRSCINLEKWILLYVTFSIQMKRLLYMCFGNVSQLWSQLRIFFSANLDLSQLTPKTAIFRFQSETEKYIFKIINHLLLIFKMYIYKSREKGPVDIGRLINEIRKIKTLEKNIAINDTKKLLIYNKKWGKTHRTIKI